MRDRELVHVSHVARIAGAPALALHDLACVRAAVAHAHLLIDDLARVLLGIAFARGVTVLVNFGVEDTLRAGWTARPGRQGRRLGPIAGLIAGRLREATDVGRRLAAFAAGRLDAGAGVRWLARIPGYQRDERHERASCEGRTPANRSLLARTEGAHARRMAIGMPIHGSRFFGSRRRDEGEVDAALGCVPRQRRRTRALERRTV